MDTKQPAVQAARAERAAELAEALRRSEVKAARERLDDVSRQTPDRSDGATSDLRATGSNGRTDPTP